MLGSLPILARKTAHPRARPTYPLFSQVSKCLIEFQTRQLHRSLGDRSLSLLAADSVLKETDKNSESFTVHRSLAQACFDPTPAATAAATPTATPYFNAIKIQKEGRRERDPKTKFLFRAIRWRDTPNVQELERNLLKKMSSPRFHFEKKLCSLNYYI